MTLPIFKVGDRASVYVYVHPHGEVVDRIVSVERAGKRLRTSDGAEWHVPSRAPDEWRRYGRGGGRLQPYQPGDEERVKIRGLRERRAAVERLRVRDEELAASWEREAEKAQRSAVAYRANAAERAAERDRLDAEIASLEGAQ